MIPKIIHLCDKDYPNKNSLLEKLYLSFLKKNQNYIINFMNDNQCKIIIKNFDYELYNIYNNLDGPGKADVWRVVILYLHGGIYCDIDIECLKSFDELLIKYNSDIMFAREPDIHWNKTNPIMCNAFMISNKNNSFWLNYIKLIKEIYYKKKCKLDRCDLGPMLLNKNYNLNNNKSNILILPTELIYPIPDISVLSYQNNTYKKMLKESNYNDAYVVHYWLHTDFLFNDNNFFGKNINEYLLQYFNRLKYNKYYSIQKIIKYFYYIFNYNAILIISLVLNFCFIFL